MILHGILQELKIMHLNGHLPNFIKKLSTYLRFSVRLLNQYSDEYERETGVPQGSVINLQPYS